jgi:hypothetical protein
VNAVVQVAARGPVSLAGRPTLLAALVVMVTAVVLSVSPLGAYLNLNLFYDPLRVVEASAGLGPPLDPRIRLVLLDDRSLERLGRLPTFPDWYAVSCLLFDLGYDEVYLFGSQDIGPIQTERRHSRGRLFVGGAFLGEAPSSRAMEVKDIPDRLFAAAASAAADGHGRILGLPKALAPVDAIGHLNLAEPYRVRAAFPVRQGLTFPSLALLGQPAAAVADTEFYVDLLGPEAFGEAIIPASALLSGSAVGDPAALSQKVRQRLAGGRIAVLVPDGYSGARFVQTPMGERPAYLVPLSLLSQALRGALCRALPAPLLWILLPGLLAVAVLRLRSLWRALLAAGLVALGYAALGSWGLWRGGWYAPLVPGLLAVAAAIIVRIVYHYGALARAHFAMNADLLLGREVQRTCMPASSLAGAAAGWCWEARFLPLGALSGDWLQVVRGGARPEALLLLGDVVGKGSSAALATTLIAGACREEEERARSVPLDADGLILRLDRLLQLTFQGEQNSTILALHLQPGKVRTLGFGASGAVCIGRDGTKAVARRVRFPSQNPIGFRLRSGAPEFSFAWQEITDGLPLAAAMVFTDGVIDGLADLSRLVKAINGQGFDAEAADFPGALMDRAIAIGQAKALLDDRTLVVVRPEPQAAGTAGSGQAA